MRVFRIFGAILVLAGATSCNSTKAAPVVAAPKPARAIAPPVVPGFEAKDIDAMLRAEWQKEGIVPAPAVDDARFLRRAYLDVLGTIPSLEEITAFANDPAPDKRAKVVASLVERPGYAEHWTTYWDDELIGKTARNQDLDRAAFRGWLRTRFATNAPWNKVVYDLVTATGQNSLGGPRNPRANGGWFPGAAANDAAASDGGAPEINGAVNWLLKYEQAPQDLAGAASRSFLGVQIQCAQCHDHKTEKWKQVDFQRFAACFTRARIKPLEAKEKGGIRRVDVEDVPRVVQRVTKNPELLPIAQASPAALDGTDLSKSADVRQALGVWITAKENPWFARAFVNRMWAHYLGRGFVDPVNDMRPSITPTMEPLLAKMADDFVLHGYDVKRLTKTICATEAYQLSSNAGPASADSADSSGDAGTKPDPDNHLWARFRLVPMGTEELLNALFVATNVEGAVKQAGFANIAQLRTQLMRQYTFLFDVDEDVDQTNFEGTVSQALVLLNGSLVGVGSTAIPGSALAEALATSGSDAHRIELLYLRALSRKPTEDEKTEWTAYIYNAGIGAPTTPTTPTPTKTAAPSPPAAAKKGGAGGPDPLRRLEARTAAPSRDPRTVAFEDLFWALLNSSEFLFNH